MNSKARACMTLALGLAACGGGGAVDADYGCMGQVGAPERGADETFAYTVKNPTDGAPFAGAEVHIFADGEIVDGCPDSVCTSLMADEDGLVDVTVPQGWFSYRVVGQPPETEDARMTTLEVDAVHPPDDEGFLNAVFEDSMRAIFSFSSPRADHGLGKAVLRGVDCTSTPVANLHPRAYDASGTELADVSVAYLNRAGDFPAIGRLGTNTDGRVFLGNLPEGLVRVELWGDLGDGVDQALSCEVVPIEAGSTTTGRLRPLRADADPTCPLPNSDSNMVE